MLLRVIVCLATFFRAGASKVVIYRGTGGIAHNMGGLIEARNYALKISRPLAVCMARHRPFPFPFERVINTSSLGVEYTNIPKRDNTMFLPGVTWSDLCYNPINVLLSPNCNISMGWTHTKKASFFIGAKPQNLKIRTGQLPCINRKFWASNFSPFLFTRPDLGVHRRCTDICSTKKEYDALLNIVQNTSGVIYLATDSLHTYESLTRQKNVIGLKPLSTRNGATNIHYGALDAKRAFIHSLIDLYYLINAEIFYPTKRSGFSALVSLYRNMHAPLVCDD